MLFIDARELGHPVDRTHRELTDEDIERIAGTYHAWRGERISSWPLAGEGGGEGYEDIPGICKSATLEEIRKHGHVLTPGRYVGAEAWEDDGEPFAEKVGRLTIQWREQRAGAAKQDAATCLRQAKRGRQVAANQKELGYGG